MTATATPMASGTPARVLVIDNYDSFVYNLAQYAGNLGADCTVVRNDAVTIPDIINGRYDAVIISPGPGTPEDERDFGVCSKVITVIGPTTPILGVCLGHQGIIHAFGGKIVNATRTRHGKTSNITHAKNSDLFGGIKQTFRATRYHSLVGDKTVIPDVLEITARADDDGEIMGVRHKTYPIEGVQFHPESIMTEHGMQMLENFLNAAQRWQQKQKQKQQKQQRPSRDEAE